MFVSGLSAESVAGDLKKEYHSVVCSLDVKKVLFWLECHSDDFDDSDLGPCWITEAV